ncbi:MAG: type III pantothenate kinase, partial [Planctomycetes bacterium]|nr:type III pantothenate kinase [Planctomycetota bacterium]
MSAVRLLLDLGNTRAHLALSPGPGQLGEVAHVAHTDGRGPWAALASQAREARVASVVPAATAASLEWLGARGLTCAVLDAASSPIALDVATPQTVGADRIANALWAARARPGEATIVVDLGTAITFEVVDAAGVFRGGAIAPGLRTQARALHTGTALLPEVTLDAAPPALGRDTPGS